MDAAESSEFDQSSVASSSFVGIAVLSGPPLTMHCGEQSETALESLREISPDRPIIIGRQEGKHIEYLDPAYSPTQMVPGSRQTVLRKDGKGEDTYVSRGHFMLRAIAGGILFVNGVPNRGGGIRPPKNGTILVEPSHRLLAPGEEYAIGNGAAIVIGLPNHAEVRIEAR